MGASNIGPLEDRVKTDVRLSKSVLKQVELLAYKIGVPKNTFFVLGISLLASQLLPLLASDKKRKDLLRDVEKLFQKTMKDIKESM